MKTVVTHLMTDKADSMVYKLKRAVAAALLAGLLAGGCATTPQLPETLEVGRPQPYRQLFEKLDKIVEQFEGREASSFPVPGFPYLRTDRFLWSMEDRINTDNELQWIEAMRQLDLRARDKEIRNLPDEALAQLRQSLTAAADRRELKAAVGHASEQLLAHDRQYSGYLSAVKEAVQVTGEYVTARRVFGLYPIAAVPVTAATKKQYDVFREWHAADLEALEFDGQLTVFKPAAAARSHESRKDLRRLFDPSRCNDLGLPDLSAQERKRLVLAYAPVIEQDVVGSYDLFGKIKWRSERVKIDYGSPTLYYYFTHSLLNGAPVLQVNYAFWYSGRFGENAPRIERGPLDGVTIRVTFDPGGDPVMVDIMNNCGCYHFFVPRREKIAQINSSSNGLYPFVPAWLPDEFPDRRLHLRINSGWHQIQKITARQVPVDAVVYELRPYDELEALPRGENVTENVFSPDGIMKDSSRIEPYIFFSMGIPKVGYMRQRGHHAIKLVGRGHFTDTDIYDRYFLFR